MVMLILVSLITAVHNSKFAPVVAESTMVTLMLPTKLEKKCYWIYSSELVFCFSLFGVDRQVCPFHSYDFILAMHSTNVY